MAAQLLCLVPENLRHKFPRAHSTGICLHNGIDFLNGIGRDTACAHSAIACQRRGGGGHGIDAHVRVAQRAELALQQNSLARLHRVMQQGRGIHHIRREDFLILHELFIDFVPVQRLLMVKLGVQHVFQIQNVVNALIQSVLVIIQIAYLETDFRIFVGIEGRNARLGGAERLIRKPCLLQAVQLPMVRHQHLAAVGNGDFRLWHASVPDILQLVYQIFHAKGHAVADNI